MNVCRRLLTGLLGDISSPFFCAEIEWIFSTFLSIHIAYMNRVGFQTVRFFLFQFCIMQFPQKIERVC